jgi:hypothetical protein
MHKRAQLLHCANRSNSTARKIKALRKATAFGETRLLLTLIFEMENLKGRDNFGELDADGRIILKLFLYK